MVKPESFEVMQEKDVRIRGCSAINDSSETMATAPNTNITLWMLANNMSCFKLFPATIKLIIYNNQLVVKTCRMKNLPHFSNEALKAVPGDIYDIVKDGVRRCRGRHESPKIL